MYKMIVIWPEQLCRATNFKLQHNLTLSAALLQSIMLVSYLMFTQSAIFWFASFAVINDLRLLLPSAPDGSACQMFSYSSTATYGNDPFKDDVFG